MKSINNVSILCADWGVVEKDITVEVLNISVFSPLMAIPRVSETLVTDKGCYLIEEVGFDLQKGCINLWGVNEDNSDFYD